MTKSFKIESLDKIDQVAQEFIDYISSSEMQSNIFAFYGKMGAGKTTFIKSICKALGVEDVVNSPTFTIVNEYRSSKGFPIYHFDFYRIKNIDEAYDIGLEDYFSKEGLSLIEWPEMIESILPEDIIRVKLTADPSDNKRIIEIL